jgi:hypothetical protein
MERRHHFGVTRDAEPAPLRPIHLPVTVPVSGLDVLMTTWEVNLFLPVTTMLSIKRKVAGRYRQLSFALQMMAIRASLVNSSAAKTMRPAFLPQPGRPRPGLHDWYDMVLGDGTWSLRASYDGYYHVVAITAAAVSEDSSITISLEEAAALAEWLGGAKELLKSRKPLFQMDRFHNIGVDPIAAMHELSRNSVIFFVFDKAESAATVVELRSREVGALAAWLIETVRIFGPQNGSD